MYFSHLYVSLSLAPASWKLCVCLCFSLEVLICSKECLICSHVSWGFTHLLLALSSTSGFAIPDRNTIPCGAAASGHHSWVHPTLLPSIGHSCLFCENHLAILVLLQSILLPGEHLSLWLPNSTSFSWASQSPTRFFKVPKQFHSEWGK